VTHLWSLHTAQLSGSFLREHASYSTKHATGSWHVPAFSIAVRNRAPLRASNSTPRYSTWTISCVPDCSPLFDAGVLNSCCLEEENALVLAGLSCKNLGTIYPTLEIKSYTKRGRKCTCLCNTIAAVARRAKHDQERGCSKLRSVQDKDH